MNKQNINYIHLHARQEIVFPKKQN